MGYAFSGFNQYANNAINVAIIRAGAMGHTAVGTEHMMLGLLDENSGPAYVLLTRMGVTFHAYQQSIISTLGKEAPTIRGANDLTSRARQALEMALLSSRRNGASITGSEHLLITLLKNSDCYAVKLLHSLEIDVPELYGKSVQYDLEGKNELEEKSPSERQTSRNRKAHPILEQYATDLSAQANDGELDPVIGRETEIDRVIQILMRRQKNNPCLIGEAGVGKTAVVEGLAQRILHGTVPEELKSMRIYNLDLNAMVAGSKYRGDFEQRIKDVMAEAAEDKDVILFIDEIHSIVGTGAVESEMDASNILKPYLARGKIKIIGATTTKEFRIIEKDSALERRFQCVMVDEPSSITALEILRGLQPKYEQHHGLQITDDALFAAVSLSERYMHDRRLPDKAIDLIDEAASRLRLNKGQGDLRRDGIEAVVSQMTGIDVKALSQTDSDALIHLEDTMHQSIVGQAEAVSAVANAIRRGKVGLKDNRRPVGSFLFLGPTGVGKTELCLSLAKAMFQEKDALVRIDMSEYMEKQSVAKLIGSPPGYVGHEDGGQLTEQVRRKPYAVVLFDEIEKAHPDVLDILLQIMEDGQLTDSLGRKVSFRHTVVILTSNVGARQIAENKAFIGFGSQSPRQDRDLNVMKQVRETFRPEMLNRVDDIVVFRSLSKSEVGQIAVLLLNGLTEKAAEMGITLTFAESAINRIVDIGYDEDYGARPLRRAVQKEIEDVLAGMILTGSIRKGQNLLCEYNGRMTFREQEKYIIKVC